MSCVFLFLFLFFWSHPASRGFLMSNVAISKDMATVVCVCESAYECFMHVCDWLWVLTDVFLIAICLLCSRGSRRRNSLRFSRAWWSSWIKTCTVLTTTWSRSAQNTEEEPHTHLRNLHWSQKSSIFQINKWMNSSFNFTLLPATKHESKNTLFALLQWILNVTDVHLQKGPQCLSSAKYSTLQTWKLIF